MFLRLTALSILLVAANDLSAQGTAQGHVEAVTDGEDRDATRLGDSAYESRFQGLWAEDGACGDHERTWAFSVDSVMHGSLSCIGLGKMTWEDGRLLVPLGDCQMRGDDVTPEALSLSDPEGAEIIAVYGDNRLTLLPCTGN